MQFARSLARRAREDLDALRVLHERGGIADAVVGFHAQQAVEKALKSAIVAAGGHLRRTHDLRFLIEQAEDLRIQLSAPLAEAAWLTPWAVELRYDEYLEEELDRDRAVRAVVAAVEMVERQIP
ncbi:MAG TPA: HEPN domain-containing protein [Baekduia sp.]|nr:HEPN domain-containing protein [Baekduia sp.]